MHTEFGIRGSVADQEITLLLEVDDHQVAIVLTPEQAAEMGFALQKSAQEVRKHLLHTLN